MAPPNITGMYEDKGPLVLRPKKQRTPTKIPIKVPIICDRIANQLSTKIKAQSLFDGKLATQVVDMALCLTFIKTLGLKRFAKELLASLVANVKIGLTTKALTFSSATCPINALFA